MGQQSNPNFGWTPRPGKKGRTPEPHPAAAGMTRPSAFTLRRIPSASSTAARRTSGMARSQHYKDKSPEGRERTAATNAYARGAEERAISRRAERSGYHSTNPNRHKLLTADDTEKVLQQVWEPGLGTHNDPDLKMTRRNWEASTRASKQHRKRTIGKPIVIGRRTPDFTNPKTLAPKSKKAKRRREAVSTMIKTPKNTRGFKEFSQQFKEMYEFVLEYLLNEGYADSYETADGIFQVMSENWFAEILEEGAGSRGESREAALKLADYIGKRAARNPKNKGGYMNLVGDLVSRNPPPAYGPSLVGTATQSHGRESRRRG